jgi:hypothetical protein
VAATGDFNGDGKTDLAVANLYADQVAILLGNGDGSFQSAVAYPTGNTSIFLAVANLAVVDFNGDGNADLAIGTTGGVAVMLGNGDGTFRTAVIYASDGSEGGPSAEARMIAAGDFNSRGTPDLAVANSTGDYSILLGNGDGTLSAPMTSAYGIGPNYIAVGDLNGDGKPDLAIVNINPPANTNSLDILLGNGDGTFRTATTYLPYEPLSVAIGDLNGDGIPDLAVAGVTGVRVYLGNGDGTFQTPTTYESVDSAGKIALADVNGDGRLDIVFFDNSSDTVGVLQGLPALPTTTTLVSSQNPSSYGQTITLTASVAPSAATGTVAFRDGENVMGTSSLGSGIATLGQVSLSGGTHSLTATYSGDTTYGTSTSPVLSQTISQLPTTTTLASSANPAVAGQNVILTATVLPSVATGQVVFMDGSTILGTRTSNAGSATLVVSTLASGTQILTAVYSGDANYAGSTSPGLAEIVPPGATRTATTTSLTSAPNPVQYGHSIALTATVSPPSATGSVTYYDGVNVIGSSLLAGGLTSFSTSMLASGIQTIKAIYAGDASNAPSVSAPVTEAVTSVQQNGFRPAMSVGVESRYVIATADFNRDGRTDLLISTSSGFAAVMLGNGDGTFQPPLVTNAAGGAVVGDFNGDGKPDLVAENAAGAPSVYLGNGDGTFQSPIASGTGGLSGLSFVVGDFNEDGKADLAVAGSSNVAVLLGNGDGTFQAALNYPGGALGGIVIADFNGDGNPDLAMGGISNVSVLLGNGDGTFRTALGSGIDGLGVQTLAVGDFNGDGKPDLVISLVSNSVNVLLGKGDGTFQSPVGYAAGYLPNGVAVGDFNADGKLDMVAANSGVVGANDVSIFYGNGDGTFQAPINYMSSGLSYTLAVADFNGDGRADLVIANQTSAVCVLLGATPSPPSEAGIFRDNFEWILDANGNRVFDGTGPGEDYVYNNFIPPAAGDIPVVGDWSGSGTTKIGIYRSSTGQWFLDYNGDGVFDAGDRIDNFGGIAGDTPVVGDWTGSGTSKIGIFRYGFYWLLDIDGNGVFDAGDQAFAYGGVAGDVPVVGDWSGNGVTKVGVVRPFQSGGTPAFWLLDANNDHAIDTGDFTFAFGGIAGDVPIVGDWNGSGFSKAGVYREGFYWVTDNNGSAPYYLGSFQVVAFPFGGVPGDVPVVGKW